MGVQKRDHINLWRKGSVLAQDHFYKAIFDNTSTPTAILDEDASILKVNKAFCTLSGYTFEELEGSNWKNTMPPEDVARLREYGRLRRTKSNIAPAKFQVRYYKKNGKLRHCLISVSPLEQSSQYIITLVDITEDIKMDEVLADSIFFFRESQRAAFIGSYKADFITGKWESSEVLDQIFGIHHQYEHSIDPGWTSIIHPDDRPYILNYLETEILEKKRAFDSEYRIIRKSDGKIRWVHGLGDVAVNNEGKVISLIGTIQDITDRKLKEQEIRDQQAKLDIALKIAKLGQWEYDVEANIFHFNDNFYNIFNTTSDEMGGNYMTPQEYAQKFVYPDDFDIVAVEIKNALETNDPKYSRQIEHRMLYANGEMGYIAVRFTIVKNDKGQTEKLFGINQDITAIKKAEVELQENEAKLRELNAMKDKFVSIIAHDLKSPFSSIIGFSQLLNEESSQLDKDKIARYSEQIMKASEKSFDLLNNLMEWSKSETGRMKFAPELIHLQKSIHEVLDLLRPQADQKKITIENNVPEDIIVYADESMLATVLRNLISNAIKFSFIQGRVMLKANATDQEVLVKVYDNGTGMSEKNTKKLFRIDENLSTPGTQNEHGTGLGLILCKEFIEKHGGKIWVNSENGKGSEFCFTLPNRKYK